LIAFVHINKTAGTTMKFVLRNSFGVHHCDIFTQHADGILRDDDLRFARRLFPGLWSISGHHLRYPSGVLSGDFGYATLLREPIARCVSHFQQVARRDGSRRGRYWKAEGDTGPRYPLELEDFLAQTSNLHVQRIAGEVDVELAKKQLQDRYLFVGLTERFAESIRVFQALCPYSVDPSYQSLRVARDKSVQKALFGDPGILAMLRRANEADLELYEWVREVLYPEQLERSGLSRAELERPLPTGGRKFNYRVCRVYNNAIYRQMLKARYLLTQRDRPSG
jgi:hypothetical protein